jgi:hypothetical protein
LVDILRVFDVRWVIEPDGSTAKKNIYGARGEKIEIVSKRMLCKKRFAISPSPELVVLVDFVFPWGIEYPVVFLPQGLFTLWCLQMA